MIDFARWRLVPFLLVASLCSSSNDALAAPAQKASLSQKERAKIEALLTVVRDLRGATFVRNGKAYGGTTAARFLRGKWEDRAADVLSAEDFVAKIATRSSTTGKVYVVRYDDGREVPTADFLRAELAKLR